MTAATHGVAWRPEHVADPDRLAQLIDDPRIEVVDTLDQQRRDLDRILPSPAPEVLTEPPHWYYYPWRRTLVRLLGPESFRRLRSDRNRNKITVEEQRRLRGLAVGVVGLSSGYAIAAGLVLEGVCGQIRLADFDTVDLSNLNRIPGTVFDLGVNKTVVAARRIAELDPYVDVRILPEGLDLRSSSAFVDGLHAVVEQCDSFDIKLAVREAARSRGVPVLMATADRGLFDVERYDLDPSRPLFHGLLGDAQPADLMNMTTEQRVPYVRRVLEADELSERMASSMAEVGLTVSTWPQLGTDINLGAAMATAAVRRLGLGEPLPSGRVRADLDEILVDMAEVRVTSA